MNAANTLVKLKRLHCGRKVHCVLLVWVVIGFVCRWFFTDSGRHYAGVVTFEHEVSVSDPKSEARLEPRALSSNLLNIDTYVPLPAPRRDDDDNDDDDDDNDDEEDDDALVPQPAGIPTSLANVCAEFLQSPRAHATPGYALFCEPDMRGEHRAAHSDCPILPPMETLHSIWLRGVALVGEACMRNSLLHHSAVTTMHGDVASGEPSEFRLWAPARDSGAAMVAHDHHFDSYLLSQRSVDEGELMVDVGAHLGAAALRIASRSPDGRFLLVEAAPMTFIYQLVNLWCNLPPSRLQGSSPQIIPVLAALTGTGNETMHVKYGATTTHMSSTWMWTQNSTSVQVQTTRLETLLAQNGLQNLPIPLFHINCRGCEYAVLPTLSGTAWQNVRAANGQMHVSHVTGTEFVATLQFALSKALRLGRRT